MTHSREAQFKTDLPAKTLTVTRHFKAPVDAVWRAWTEASLLDQWWAPKPFKAETRTLDFREGGHWLYAMKGPAGECQWCIVDFTRIELLARFDATTAFCDSDGVRTREMPTMIWSNRFEAVGGGTRVTCVLQFESEEALHLIVQMGFREGFTMGLNNLDALLQSQA